MRGRKFNAWNWLLLVILAPLLLALLTLVLVDLFDTQLFRTVVAPRIEQRIGRNVEVDGLDLRWGWPVQVRLDNLSIANAPWGHVDAMLSIPAVTVTLDPTRLLSGQPYAHVYVREPRVVVETSAAGAMNWNPDLDQPTETLATDEAALPVSVRAEGGQVEYHNHAAERLYTVPIELFTLRSTDGVEAAAPEQAYAATLQASYRDLPIDMDATLHPAPGHMRAEAAIRVGASDLAGSVEVSSFATPLTLSADLQSDVLALDEMMTSLSSDTPDAGAAPTIHLDVLQGIDAQVTLDIGEIRVNETTLDVNSATLNINAAQLELDVQTTVGMTVLDTALQVDASDPQPVLKVRMTLPNSAARPLLDVIGLPARAGRVESQVTAELHLRNGELALEPVTLLAGLSVPEASLRYEAAGETAETLVLQGEVSEPGAAPEFSIELRGLAAGMISARATAPPLPQIADASYPIRATLMAPAAAADIRVDLRKILAAEPRRLQASVDADLIDLTALPDLGKSMPGGKPADAEQAELATFNSGAAGTRDAAAAQGFLAPLLTAIDMDLSLTVDQLVLHENFTLMNIDTQVELDAGRLRAEPLNFSTPAGALHGSLTANANHQPTSVQLALRFDALRPARIVADVPDIAALDQPLSGNLQLSFTERPPADTSASALLLPELGRIVLEQAGLDLRTRQGDTHLSLELSADAQRPAQQLLLHVTGQLRGTAVDVSFQGGSLQALRDTERPYQWTLRLDAEGAEVEVDGTLVVASGEPELAMRISAQQRDSEGLTQLLQPWVPTGLPAFDVSAMLVWRQDAISVTDLDAQLGDSDLTGSVSYSTSEAGVHNVDARLHSMQLDLGELQELRADTGSNEEGAADSGADVSTVLPREALDLAFLQQLNADFHYTADNLYLAETALGSADMDLSAKQGQLALEPLYLEVAGGDLRIEADLNAQDAWLQGSIQAEARRLDLNSLFRGSSLVKDAFGRLGGQARFWMRGDSTAALLGSLDGGLLLMLSGGVIDPVLVEGAGLDIGEALLAAAGIGAAIPLNCAYASAYAREGELSMDRVVVDTTDSTFYLTGSVDLQQETLDLALHNESKHLTPLASSSPLALRGTFSDPEVVLLTEALASDGLQGLALAALAAPAAALLAFIDTNSADEVPPACRGWVETLREAL